MHVGEQRPAAPARRLRADLLVVEQGGDGEVRHRAAAAASAEIAAQHDTWLSSRPLAISDRRRRARRPAARRRGTGPRTPAPTPACSASQSANVAVADVDPVAHTGRRCDVAVEHQPALVDVAVEVDRQLRHPRDRLGDVDQRRRPVGGDDPPGDPEVAVEPAVEQRTAVHLDAEQPPVGDRLVGSGVDAQAGRVGVGADDAQTPPGCRRPAPGDEGAAAPDEPGGGTGAPRAASRSPRRTRRRRAARRPVARRATATARSRGSRAGPARADHSIDSCHDDSLRAANAGRIGPVTVRRTKIVATLGPASDATRPPCEQSCSAPAPTCAA